MGFKCFGFGCALTVLMTVHGAGAAVAAELSNPGSLPDMVAQNTDNGGTVFSQDSIYQNNRVYAGGAPSLRQEVEAAETSVNINAAFMHSQYHENFPPGTGDDENGFTEGFGVGMSALVPDRAIYGDEDIYTSLAYDFSAGNIAYGGHLVFTGQPASATDRAVFNRIEARLGVGFPLAGGFEVIPFFAGGYQSWNRNIDSTGAIGTDELYHSFLVGGGIKLDLPLTRAIVASFTGEALALVGGGIAVNNLGVSNGFGPSAEERVALGLDYNFRGPFHAIVSAYWEHFSYSGTQPQLFDGGAFYYYEPISVTTQFGMNVGLGYSF